MSEEIVYSIRVITFGYSDSEDRLWLRLVIQEHPDVQYWITRRFLLRWVNSLSESLFDTVKTGVFPASHEPQKCVALEFIEARNNREPDAPPPPPENGGEESRPVLCGLLNTIKINANSDGTSFTFTSIDGENYRLDLDRIASYSLLHGLLTQVDIAQWHRPDEQELRRSWSSPAFLKEFED